MEWKSITEEEKQKYIDIAKEALKPIPTYDLQWKDHEHPIYQGTGYNAYVFSFASEEEKYIEHAAKIIFQAFNKKESEILQEEFENEDNPIKSWSLFFKVKRAKRLEVFEEKYLQRLQCIIDVKKRQNGSFTFEWRGGTYDFFPKKNKLLHRQNNSWKTNGLEWICKQILKK